MTRPSKFQSTPLAPERVKTDGATPKKGWDVPTPKTGKNQSAYDKYKQSLHEIFDGKKPMPNKMKDMLETRHPAVAPDDASSKPEPQDPPKKVRRRVAPQGPTLGDLIQQAKTAKTSADLRTALSTIKEKGFELPADDEEILVKALDHDDDEIVMQALNQLETFLDNETSKNPTLLKTRLQSAQMVASNGKIRRKTTALLDLLA